MLSKHSDILLAFRPPNHAQYYHYYNYATVHIQFFNDGISISAVVGGPAGQAMAGPGYYFFGRGFDFENF